MSAESKTETHRLIVGGVPEHFNLPWHLAIEQNAFKRIGVDLQFVDYPGGTGAMTRALRNREVDMAILLTEGCVKDLLASGPGKIVKYYVRSPLIWGIHVAANSQIESVAQIRNQRYAISRFGSGSHLMAIVDACERGWTFDQIEFELVRNLKGARAALAAGDADVFFWEKYTTQPYVGNGEFRRVGIRETLWPAFVVCAHESWLQNQPGVIKKTLEVVNDSCRTLMENPCAVDLISDRYHLAREGVEQWFSVTRWDTGFDRDPATLQTARDYLLKLGQAPDGKMATRDLWFEL